MSCSRRRKSGALEEAWCVGTAAVISPIGELAWGDEKYEVNHNQIGALSQKLYDELTGIQQTPPPSGRPARPCGDPPPPRPPPGAGGLFFSSARGGWSPPGGGWYSH